MKILTIGCTGLLIVLVNSALFAKGFINIVVDNGNVGTMNWCMAAVVGPGEDITNTKGPKYETKKNENGSCSTSILPGKLNFNMCYLTGFSSGTPTPRVGCNFNGVNFNIQSNTRCYFACQYIVP